MSRVLKWLFGLLLLCLVGLSILGGAALWWWQKPLSWVGAPQAVHDLDIPSGTHVRGVARQLRLAGVEAPEWLLQLALRLSLQSRHVQAGSYELPHGIRLPEVVDKLVRGEQAVRRLTLVEGWTVRQMLAALQGAEHLTLDIPPDTDAVGLARVLGLSVPHAEGRLFPDTYVYPKHSKASELLKQAARAMDRQLADVWAQRQADLPLRSPDEALVLASLVEKESGRPADRVMIAGVFINRLRIGMRLQTDPSVIYGLGERFDGNLRRVHLQTDGPYNSYTRAGLPPTPIAAPGRDALLAAVRPAATDALYFVARGDGSSAFSRSLDEHNRAVARYQLGR